VSDAVTLVLRAPLDNDVEVRGVKADLLATLSEREIAALPALIGRRQAQLGDLFHVSGGRSSKVRIEGSLKRVQCLASGMAAGELLIDGDVGDFIAANMSGGWIDVRGDAGDGAGLAMSGGALRITGNAGHRVGAGTPGASKGMTGGEIIVNGAAGDEVAARARRGLVVIGGDAGEHTARAIIAGTVIVLGRTGAHAGRGSKRGSIVAIGGIDVPTTYQYACTYQPPHVRLTLTYLYRRYGLTTDDRVLNGVFRRYCGDAGEPSKGEILEFVA
jgi:formylmethanofuran dehydrogenase subunit C